MLAVIGVVFSSFNDGTITAVANKTILELRREMRALSSFIMMMYLELMVMVYVVASIRHVIGMKMYMIGCMWLARACTSCMFAINTPVQTCSVSTLLTGLPHDVVGCVTMMMSMVTAPFHPTGSVGRIALMMEGGEPTRGVRHVIML